MLTSIKGVYEQGRIFMNEEPPVTAKTDVIITFLSEVEYQKNTGERIPGGLKGKVTIPDDFNEPIEL